MNWIREEVFPFHAELAANGVTDFMDGARLVIDEPTVLTQVVSQLNDLHLDRVDADTKGDLFEHVLRQIRQAGELGQFRTPRHVIRALVRLVDPWLGETVYDPAAGTAGFLVGAWDHIRLTNSSPPPPAEWTHPGRDPIRSLVYSANGSSVDTVIIDGRIVMRSREVLTVDEEKIGRDVVAAGKAWMARAGVRPTCPWPVHA